nr:retrovirus-related Pol polyprotein from transposon TNT 1-94 [Tanacetum cinerariifolium]
MANVSKSISISNEEFSDDTTPSVACKFLNEVKSTIVTLQRVVKHKMTLETHNWSYSAHQKLHKIVKDENFPIVNQVDARVQNFEIQFLREAAKFVGDFKYLAIKHDESLAKYKTLEFEIERLLRAVVSQDIVSVVQNNFVIDTSNLQTELERKPLMLGEIHALSKPVTLNSVPTPQESKVMKNDKVIAPGMFRINPFKTFREAKHVPNNVRASSRTKPITVSQPSVITKKDVNSDSNGLSSIGIDNTKTRRPYPRSNTTNDRVPYASKSSQSKNKGAEVEEHHRNLLLSKNTKHMSSALVRNKWQMFQSNKNKKRKPKVKKPKKVGFIERLATPKPSKPKYLLRWSPTGRMFDLNSKIIDFSESESQSDCSNGDNACTSNTLEPKIKQFLNSTSLLGKLSIFVYGANDHVATILGFGDLQWGNILITRVYFIEGLGHNLFSIGRFYDSDLEVAFRKNACFVRNLEGIDLLKGDRSTNLYTINLHDMASTSPICLMAHASSSKSWLWHQHLSHLNFDTINDLARNDLVLGLLKFKYHKEHLFPSCEQGKKQNSILSTKTSSKFKAEAFLLPAIKFPLPEELPTASEDGSNCQKKREVTARKIALLSKTKRNCQSKKDGSYTKLVAHVLPLILAVTVNCNIVYKDSLSYKRSHLVIVESIQLSKHPSIQLS